MDVKGENFMSHRSNFALVLPLVKQGFHEA
jgi:hypothetical protein